MQKYRTPRFNAGLAIILRQGRRKKRKPLDIATHPTKSMYSILEITNCDYGFSYSQLVKWFTQEEVLRYCNSFREQCSKITKKWNKSANAEWSARHYLAAKMILSASVMISSADYSKKKNIKITEPYLYYYSILSCCRSLLFTLPRIPWSDGDILEMTHQKILNIGADAIGVMSKKRGEQVKMFFDYAKSMRELFSYKFPAFGIDALKNSEKYKIDYIINVCSLICEVAQLNSELMQASISKNSNGSIELSESDLECCFVYDVDGDKYIDQDDWYRINYMTRKIQHPLNIHWMMTEGLVEDFFGAWIPGENCDDDAYNADEYWSMIYPAP